jgi:hypothetical protein
MAVPARRQCLETTKAQRAGVRQCPVGTSRCPSREALQCRVSHFFQIRALLPSLVNSSEVRIVAQKADW